MITVVVVITVTVILVMSATLLLLELDLIKVPVVKAAVRARACAGAVSDMFVKMLPVVGMRADVLIILSKVAVDLLMDATVLGVLGKNTADILAGLNARTFAGIMIPFDLDMSDPVEDFCCSAAFDFRRMDALD